MTSFQAKIKLAQTKKAPLTHDGYKGRKLAKGESFTSTDPEEAAYYRAQPGFSVVVLKGKLAAPGIESEDEDDLDTGHDGPDEEEDEESGEHDEAVKSGHYSRADLKKLSRVDLRKLIKSDESIPLSIKEVPKTASKKEIINLIIDAQKDAARD